MSFKVYRIIALLIAVLLMAPLPFAQSAPTTASAGGSVIMISLDGLAGFYLDDPRADMPTLRQLAREGARAKSMKVVAPSVTWPNHTTLVTGDTPARHGVVGNNYLDRKTGKTVTLIGDPVLNEPQIVRVPTIYDVAHQAGMTTAAIRWPATRGAITLDWTIPTCHTQELIDRYSSPGLIAECKAAGVWKGNPPDDRQCTRIFNYILRTHHPRLALLHLADTDHEQHSFGPRSIEAYRAIHTADGEVRQVWDEIKRDYPQGATLIIVSDHGFSPIHGAVLPNVILRDAGLIKVKGNKIIGDIRIVPQGGAALVYILNNSQRDQIESQITKALAGAKGIEKVVPTDQLNDYGVGTPAQDPHAPDMVLFANEGYVFGDTAAGALPFKEKPERRGSHGHDPNLPDLHATFIAWGAGIKSGTKLGIINNTAVAPTIVKLLGLELPNPDGKPLGAISSGSNASDSVPRG